MKYGPVVDLSQLVGREHKADIIQNHVDGGFLSASIMQLMIEMRRD